MTPEVSPATADLQPVQPIAALPQRRDPVWGWRDIGLFIGLALPCFLVTQLIVLGIATLLHFSPKDPFVIISAQAFLYLALFALLALILRVNYDVPFWRSLAWQPSSISAGAAIGTGFALAFALAALGGLLHLHNDGSDIEKLLERPHGLIAVTLFATTLGPFGEELAFRGFFQPVLIRSIGAVAGILISGSLFGMLHFHEYGNSWGSAAIISLAGIAFGSLRYFARSTRASILAHVAYNSTLFIAFFLGKNATT